MAPARARVRALLRRRTPRSRRPGRSRSPGCPACRRPAGRGAARTRAPRPSARSPTGKTARGELLLRQREQEVRLVLRGIDAALQQIAAGRPRRARRARSGRSRPRRRRSRARARAASRTSGRCCSARTESACGPAAYSSHEVRDDLLVELPLEVHDVVRDVDRRGDAPRVVEVVDASSSCRTTVCPSL